MSAFLNGQLGVLRLSFTAAILRQLYIQSSGRLRHFNNKLLPLKTPMTDKQHPSKVCKLRNGQRGALAGATAIPKYWRRWGNNRGL